MAETVAIHVPTLTICGSRVAAGCFSETRTGGLAVDDAVALAQVLTSAIKRVATRPGARG